MHDVFFSSRVKSTFDPTASNCEGNRGGREKKTKKSVLLLLNVCSTGTIISLAFIMFNGIPDVNRRVVSGIEIVVEGTRARERGICDVRIKRGRMFL